MSQEPSTYLKRDAEHLVLEGYRFWSSGIICGDLAHWDAAASLFQDEMGISEGPLALEALKEFAKTLGLCAHCPLKTSPVGCKFLCRDEVMILGLLAGLQHGEDTTVALCLDALAPQYRHLKILNAAETLATVLRTFGKALLPVPGGTIKSIITENLSSSSIH